MGRVRLWAANIMKGGAVALAVAALFAASPARAAGTAGREAAAPATFHATRPMIAQADPLAPPPDLDVPSPNGAPPGYIAMPAPPDTCAALARAVQQQGYVIRSAGLKGDQRYVRDESFCALGLVTIPAWVSTRDNPQCFIGYTCGAGIDGGR